MFIELVDALRCPNPHEESWLVASADRMEARHIVEGTLGCPVCGAEYPIHHGVVDFRRSSSRAEVSGVIGTGVALRLAALLDLRDGHGFALLLGAWGVYASELSALVDTPLVVIDPPVEVVGAPGVSVLRSDGPLPLAAGAARATAIDATTVERAALATRATKPKGRIVAPISVMVPEDVRELARDDTLWVGERESVTSPLVTLHVRRG